MLTNIYIPYPTGHDAALYLRKKCPKMRVLLVAGLPDDQRIEVRTAGEGFEVFPRPFTAAQLTEKVREVLSALRHCRRYTRVERDPGSVYSDGYGV